MRERTAGRRGGRAARVLAVAGIALGVAGTAGVLPAGAASTTTTTTTTTTTPAVVPTTPTGAPVVGPRPPACANAIQVVVGTVTSPPTPIPPSASTVGGAQLSQPGLQVSLPPGTAQPPVVPAAGWVVADLATGNVIASCNAHAQFMPASTMKILTALALETKVDPRSTYVALPADAQIDGTKVGLSPGSTYSGNDLWHGLLMSSGNDAAHALADLAGGPTVAAELMAAEARRLGGLDTVPVNTSGLDAPGQVTSAYDLALFGREALAHPYLAKIMTTRTYSFPGKGIGNGKARTRYQIQSHNRLLGAYPGTTGVKNGYTVQAGGSFVGSASRAGRSYVVALLRADGRTSDMARQLLDWAFTTGPAAAPVGRLVTAADVTAGVAGSGPGTVPTPALTPTPGLTSAPVTAGPVATPTPGATAVPTLAQTPSSGSGSSTADAWAAGVVLGAVAAFGLVSAVMVVRRARLRAAEDDEPVAGLLSRRLGGPPRVSGKSTKQVTDAKGSEDAADSHESKDGKDADGSEDGSKNGKDSEPDATVDAKDGTEPPASDPKDAPAFPELADVGLGSGSIRSRPLGGRSGDAPEGTADDAADDVPGTPRT